MSLPLAAVCANSFFGLGSVLLVPALAVGLWRAVPASDRERRVWWFGFTVAVGLFLPACPASERLSCDFARYVQGLTQRGALSLPVDIIELCCLSATVLAPLLCACLAGIVAGELARGFARLAARGQATDVPDGVRWQFSLREFFLAMAAVGLVLAWNGHYLTDRGAQESEHQRAFLARFEESFRSGEIELLAGPVVSEQQGATVSALSFKAPGQNEYRIVAPIERNGLRRWAVWAYTTNEDNQGFIYQYAYAEVEREAQLPQAPAPAKRYIEGTWELVDGVPCTAGPSATVIGVATPALLGRPLVITARAPAGTVCELKVFPLTEATRGLPPRAPDSQGIVRWSWTPEWAGPFNYELRCIDNRASGRMVNCTRGTIPQFAVAPDY
ncbi:MAG TPA: hypothetical protein VNH11_20300 [Pirellulales bacterium]|nr:hypothetical protein [Pirellulales bacterium]